MEIISNLDEEIKWWTKKAFKASHDAALVAFGVATGLKMAKADYGAKDTMNPSTFDYLTPTTEQIDQMAKVRWAAKAYAEMLEQVIPDGPDKTYLLRKLREVGMWANVAITRLPDGTPRKD